MRMTAREDTIERIERCLELTSEKSITVTIPRLTAERAVSMLKEQEAKTGHWIFESQYCEAWSHKCSECGKRMTTAVNTFANWCWNCGAKMTDRR